MKYNLLPLVVTLLLLVSCQFTHAQVTYTWDGTVSDATTGESLPGVAVLIEGSNTGVFSDNAGRWSITYNQQSVTLVFSSIGYTTQRIDVVNDKTLEVKLQPSETALSEAVVTALGVVRDQKDLGYAVQKLESKELATVQSPNFVDQLAGQVAGVSVSQGATGVGSTSKITIRGEASFTNNNPLFVVDGTPINNNSILHFTNEASAGFQEVDFGNGGMEIPADDIASLTVLKGPSAAALYGTRASNGVILINTKDGRGKKGIGVSLNMGVTVDTPFQLPRFQNQFGQGNNGEFEFGDGLGAGTNDNITYSWGPELDAGNNIVQFDSPLTLVDGTVVRAGDTGLYDTSDSTLVPQATPFVSHPDNLRNFYQTGITSTINMSISSAFDKGNARLSYSELDSESIIPGVNYTRRNVGTNLSFRPTDKLTVGTSINYVSSGSDNRPSGGYGAENINYSLVAWGPRSLDISALEDYWQPGLEGQQQYSFNYTFFDNPYFILLENRNAFDRHRVFGNISAKYQLAEGLSINLRSGTDVSNEQRTFRRAFSTNRFKNGGYAEHDVFYSENNTDFLLNYVRGNDKLRMDFSVGGNRLNQSARTQQVQAVALAQPGIFQLSNAAAPLESFQFESRKRINSLYALARFNYDNFLFLDLTARNDWSSALATAFSTENTALFYPSASVSYVLSNTTELPSFISFAKLRASYAQVGNDTNPFQTQGVFQPQVPVGGSPTFSDQATVSNALLQAEKTGSVEVGADVRFMQDRIRLDATYYNALTTDQIVNVPTPISSGYSQQVVNGAAVRTQGWEVMASIVPVSQEDFQWISAFNFNRNITTVEDLPDGVQTLTLAYSRVYDNQNQTVWFQVEENGRVGDMYGTGYLKNENGEFIIGADGRYIADNSLQLLGNYNPDFTLGWNNQFAYKNWDVNFLFDWRQGGIIVSRTRALAGVAGQLEETADRPENGVVLDGVTLDGTPNTTVITAETAYRNYYDRNHEENNVYDASYLKLRQVAIGYTFGANAESGFFKDGRTLRLSLTGRNLFALSEIPHFDPEQLAVQGNTFVSGVEDMSYASTRSFGFKVGFNF